MKRIVWRPIACTFTFLIVTASMSGYASNPYSDRSIQFLNGKYYCKDFTPEGMWIGFYKSAIPKEETFFGECCLCTGEGACKSEHGEFFYFTTDPHYYWEKAKKFCEERGNLDQLKSIQVKFFYTATIGSEGRHYGEIHDLIWELNMNEEGYYYNYAPFNSSVCSLPFCLRFQGSVDRGLAPPDAEYTIVCFRGPDAYFACLKDMKCVIEKEGEKIEMNHCNNQCYVEEGVCFACDSEDFAQHFITCQKDMHGLAELSTLYPVQSIAPGETIDIPIHVTSHWTRADMLLLELDQNSQVWKASLSRDTLDLRCCETKTVTLKISFSSDAQWWNRGTVIVKAFSAYHAGAEVARLEIHFASGCPLLRATGGNVIL